jgi:FdhD protein
MSPLKRVEVVRVRGAERTASVDCAATEEPLEVRLHGQPFAVIMRTPGADRELAAGFLFSERVVRSCDEVGAIEHCLDVPASGNRHAENVVNVTLAGEALGRLDRVLGERRQITTSSACGLCGRLTIESLKRDLAPVPAGPGLPARLLETLPTRLRETQKVFAETGGLHAAGLFDVDGRLVGSAEDVGRHNAVDKVIGRLIMLERLPLTESVLVVSGRASFEIVQKALLAGVPIVAAVSAPSTLAIDLAMEGGLTLAGFVRGGSFNVYTRPDRIH